MLADTDSKVKCTCNLIVFRSAIESSFKELNSKRLPRAQRNENKKLK
jgi:hypothetical protein